MTTEGVSLYRVSREAAVATIIGKSVVGGVFAATLTAAMPCSAQTTTLYLQFGAPAVSADPYNAFLAATNAGPVMNAFGGQSLDPFNASLGAPGLALTEIATIEVRFSGPMIYVDPYNTLLSTSVPSSTQTVAIDNPHASFAFAAGYLGPRVWEGWSDK
jgi:hypothetical protein